MSKKIKTLNKIKPEKAVLCENNEVYLFRNNEWEKKAYLAGTIAVYGELPSKVIREISLNELHDFVYKGIRPTVEP